MATDEGKHIRFASVPNCQHDTTVHWASTIIIPEQDRILLVPKLVPESRKRPATFDFMLPFSPGRGRCEGELVNRFKDEEISITVTGFSLGAALATLTAMDIVVHGYNKLTKGNPDKSVMVTAFMFGSPRAGNAGLARLFDILGDHLHLLLVTIWTYMHMELQSKTSGESTPVDKLDHDLALVNKYLDRVGNEYKIPPNWWSDENRKVMVQLENGRWMVV
ncbi:hypothetical protein V6N13_004093 [Hibiscus sabdariffa]|uniref:Phospholipase A1 n=1 Tax=Hibiscus sabdariffa TaxID=183260 RepID=A0ABR2RY75_9ROSI